MEYRSMVVELLDGVELLKGRVDPLAAPKSRQPPRAVVAQTKNKEWYTLTEHLGIFDSEAEVELIARDPDELETMVEAVQTAVRRWPDTDKRVMTADCDFAGASRAGGGGETYLPDQKAAYALLTVAATWEDKPDAGTAG